MITRSPSRCAGCGHHLGQAHAHGCVFARSDLAKHAYEFRNTLSETWRPLYVKTDADAAEFAAEYEGIEVRKVPASQAPIRQPADHAPRPEPGSPMLGAAPTELAGELPPSTRNSIDYLMAAVQCYADEWRSLSQNPIDPDEARADAEGTKMRIHDMLEHDARQLAAALAARQVVAPDAERDAARYRYLRRAETDVFIIFPVPPDDSWCPHTEDLDKEVDAAIAQEKAS